MSSTTQPLNSVPPSEVPNKRPDFTGTYWASIPLPSANHQISTHILSKIEKEDLLEDEVIAKNGPIETHHHITLLMGLPSSPTSNTVNKINALHPLQIELSQKLHYFSNPPKLIEGKQRSWDVLLLEPSKEDAGFLICNDLHQHLCEEYKLKWHFDKYNPHVTIAYLKYGTAQKYVNVLQAPLKFDADHVEWKKFRDKHAPVTSILMNSKI